LTEPTVTSISDTKIFIIYGLLMIRWEQIVVEPIDMSLVDPRYLFQAIELILYSGDEGAKLKSDI